jgi:cardiolipin synthase
MPAEAGTNAYALCESAPAFVESLRDELPRCRRSLFAQFMTFEGDASGEEFADLLLAQARAGVDVRLILDHYVDVIANDILPIRLGRRRELQAERSSTAALLRRLEAGGVRLQRTAPPGTLWRFLLYRNHKKMVVLDDAVAFLGGINVSDHNYAWNDFMVKVTGPLAADMAADFRTTWDGATVPLAEPSPDRDFVLNHAPGRPSISDEVARLVQGATTSIAIESPSLLGGALEGLLVDAARRNVEVTVVAPAHHNRSIFRVWVRSTVDRLVRAGATVYGYRGSAGMTHAKLLIVDDAVATFGSFNFFELEGLTQKELNVFTRDPAIIAELRRLMDRDIAASEPMERPRATFGRFTYSIVERGFAAWTRRLLRKPEWRSTYS